MGFLSKSLGFNLSGMIAPHSIQDETSFATAAGGLVSVFRVGGLMRLLGRSDEVRRQADMDLFRALAPVFQRPGHVLQWSFARDPRWSSLFMGRHVQRLRRSAARMAFDEGLVDAFGSIEQAFVPETSLLAVWTLPNALLPHESDDQTKIRDAALDTSFSGPWQVPNLGLPALASIHKALVDTLRANLARSERGGVFMDLLTVQDAVRAWRLAIDPDNDDPTVWDQKHRPILNEHTLFGVPSIKEQILPYRVTTHHQDIVECNGLYSKTLTMSFGPSQRVRFADFIEQMSRHLDLPWGYSVTLAPSQGTFYQGIMTGFAAEILSMTNKSNLLIKDASQIVQERARKGDYLVDMRVNFSTWGASVEDCVRNSRRLEQAIRSWGSITVDGVLGDPVPYWLSMVPGLRIQSAGRLHTPNLLDAVPFLPVATPASPWAEGPLLLRSPDGKPMPVRIGSAIQNDFVMAISGSPGNGKSVLLGLITMAHLMDGGADRLPPLAIIDIGYSSQGNGKNLQDSLPPALRHQVNVMVLRQTIEHATNIFDLPLGYREPLPQFRSRLLELLVMLCTPVGLVTPPEDLYELMGYLLDMAYRKFSDLTHDGIPKKYAPGAARDKELNAWVENRIANKTYSTDRPAWWRVVDDLFDAGRADLAASAQRYAMPVLEDLIQIARDPEVIAKFGKIGKSTEAGEGILDRVARYVESACREYPILAYPTVANMKAARVNILDLAEVTAGSGPDAAKRTSIMYLAARFAATGHWYVNHREDPQRAPERYREYHREEMERLFNLPKLAIYDEFHRTDGVAPVRRVIDQDGREGRKYNIRMALSSQRLADFDEKFLEENCSTKFILSAPDNPDDLVRRFKLSPAEVEMLPLLRGPTAMGSNILCLWSTKRGNFRMMLSDPVPLEWLWAFTTTSEDRALLDALQEHVPPSTARKLAAARFGASAKSVIERRRTEGMADGIVEKTMAAEMIAAWNEQWARETREKFFA